MIYPLRRRSVALLAIVAASTLTLALMAPASAGAATSSASPVAESSPRANTFPERYSVNAAGDLVVTGNTLMTCPASSSTCAEAQSGGGTSARFNNNSYSMVMVDIDDDPGTVNSSSADLQIPAQAPVLFAGLYWGAGASGDQARGRPPVDAGTVRLRQPGATAYSTVTGSVTTLSTSGANKTYTAFADVTGLISAAGRGTYVVANVKGDLGVNHFVGWSLIVIYGDSAEPVRAMSVFDGLTSVSQGSPATIDVSGFRTPPTGPVRTALGVVAYEGDLGITGDQLLLNGSALSDARRPATNYFNSSITTKTGRFTAKTPDYVNQLGFDTGLIDATGRIANNATSATFRASSTGDQYYPAALTFSTELFSPRFAARKSVVDVDGDAVRAGDLLDYTLVLTNDVTVDNGDASLDTVITDALPEGATYVPGSLAVDGVAVADSGGVATLTAGALTLRVGTGADAMQGGRLAIGASTIVTYSMRVNADTGDGAILTNDYRVAGTAATSGFAVTGVSNETRVTVVADTADLAIVKSVSPSTLTAGQTATYTLRVSNAGPGSADSVDVTDSIPAGLTLISATGAEWSCAETAPSIRCTQPNLPAGAEAPPIVVTVTVAEAAVAGSMTNTATVSSDTPDPDPSDNTSTRQTPIVRSADLAISKSHEGNAIPGESITYTIGTRNEGPSVATGIVVDDVLPDYLSLVSASGEGWTCTVAIRCVLAGTLAPGQSAEALTIVADILPTAPSQVINTATVSGNEPDPTPGNDSATDGSITDRVFDGVESLSHPGKAIAGGPAIPVTVRSYNAGPGTVPAGADVVQTITLPSGTSLAGFSGTGWACIPSTGSATTQPLTILCALPLTIGWEATSSLTPLVLEIAVNAGEIGDKTVEAVLSTTSTVRDIDPTNNRALDIITLETGADLALTTVSSAALIAGAPAKPLTFTVRNNGPLVDSGPITVRFNRVSELALQPADGSPWACTNPDDRVVCTLTDVPVTVGGTAPGLTLLVSAPNPETLPGSFDLTGIVSSPQPDDNPSNDVATAPITIGKFADIWTAKTANPTTVNAGDIVTFTLTVSNGAPFGGPSAARDVYLNDDLGAGGLTIESITPDNSGIDCSASTLSNVSCYLAILDFGSTASVTVVARTDASWTAPDRSFTNVVRATSSTPAGDRPPGQVTVTTNPSSRMELSKYIPGRAAGTQLIPGTNATYTIDVANAGPTDARGAVVVDTMPAQITPTVALGDGWICNIAGQRVTCATDRILPVGGAIPPIQVTGLVSPDAEGEVINGATVQPLSPGTPGDDTATHRAGDFLDLDIAHFGPTRVTAGDDWRTTVAVRNNGPATEPGPIRVVVEEQSATPRRASGSGWDCDLDGRRAICTNPGPLSMGSSLPPISIVSSTPPGGTQIDSVATVSGQRMDTDRSNNRSATSAVLERPADLAVRKQAAASTVAAGGTATYRVTVTNRGPGSTDDAQVIDSLPSGLSFDRSASDARCSDEGTSIQCSAGRTLTSGESTTFRIVVRIDPALRGKITNTVLASSSQPDPDPSNNRDRTSITVTPPTQPQIPLVSPPDAIKDRGQTEIYERRPPTNAGQRARVTVTCTPILTRGTLTLGTPRGDVTYCRFFTRPGGSLWLDVPGTSALRINVRITAPAVPGYTAMDVTYRYRTSSG